MTLEQIAFLAHAALSLLARLENTTYELQWKNSDLNSKSTNNSAYEAQDATADEVLRNNAPTLDELFQIELHQKE